MTLRFKQLALASAVSTALAAGHAGASVLEEVVVTAQKREQDLQSVPVSVTAFTGEQVRDLGIQDQIGIIAQSPGVTLNDFGASPIIRIRGIGPETFSESVESSAAVYRDEVYRPTLAANGAQLFDIDRVEVLRGPQGTLYGRNTNAGLIHYYSAKPTDELDGYAEIQAGNYGQLIAEGAISGGFSDSVRGRLSLKSNTDDGYQENLGSGGGDEFGATDVQAGRAQLEFDITDALNLRLIAGASKQRNTSQIYGFRGMIEDDFATPCAPGKVLAGGCYAAAPTASGLFRVEDLNAEEGYSEASDLKNDLDAEDAAAILTWDINDSLTLVSVTGYEQLERFYQEDVDATDYGILFGFDEITGAPLFFQAAASYEMEAKTFSQEFRLLGNSDRIDWVAGFYYFDDEKSDMNNRVPEFGIEVFADVTTEAWATFGQVDFSLTDSLILTGGLRYSDDDREADVFTPLAPILVPGASAREQFEAGDGNWTYKLGLQWDLSDDLMLYGNYSTGIKSGEFNINLITVAAQAAPVGEEEIDAFEIGAKWTFLEGRGRLNAALFYNEVADYQATVYEAPPEGGLATGFFRNIGDVDVMGAELELVLNPIDNLDLLLGVSVLDSEVSSDDAVISGPLLPPDFAGGTVYPLDGAELVQAPELAFNGLARYSIPTNSAGTFFVQADFSWQDDVYLDVANDPYNVQEAYWLWNARVGWDSPSDRFYVQGFVQNADDEFYASESYTPEGFDRQGLMFGKPRTYGLKLGMRF